MSQDEHYRLFLRENKKILLADPFPEKLYESQRNVYFGEKLKNTIARPKKNQIAKLLIDDLIKGISNKEELENILKKPFIKNYLNENEKKICYEIIEVKNQNMDIDLTKLNKESYKGELIEKIKERIIYDNTAEIESAIKEAENRYYASPSVLDGKNFEEPAPLQQSDEKNSIYIPWYIKLDLISDPFPDNSLNDISETLWDKIVYKTSIFNKYQTRINKYNSELYKNIIFYGTYGSGKSTFFEYIQPILIKNNIIPINIILHGSYDAKSLQIIYERKLISALINICNKLNIYTNMKMPSDTNEIINILLDMVIASGQKGILIIIDELHKNQNLEAALEFLNNLQGYSSELRINKPHIHFGIFVAGTNDWTSVIQMTPRYSGSFSFFEDMPIITPEIACQAINMRLSTFSKNLDRPKQIQIDVMKRAFNLLIASHEDINFRSVIKYVIGEFNKGNFDILTLNYISEEKRKEIRDIFENNHVIKTRFDMLINGTKKMDKIEYKNNIRVCLSLLCKLYLNKVLYDNDIVIINNPFYFKRLAEVGLITKIVDEKSIKWIICKELEGINEEIKNKYNISIENYLIDIYCIMEDENNFIKENDNINSLIKLIPTNIKKSVIKNLKESMIIKNDIDILFANADNINSINTIDKRVDIKNKMLLSIENLTKSIILYDKINISNIDTFWYNYWYYTDNILKYYRYINNLDNMKSIEENNNNLAYLYQVFKNSFEDIKNFIFKQFKLSTYLELPTYNLKKYEVQYFQNIRELWDSQQYKECYIKISDLLEEKLRRLILNTFDILYGSNYETRLDPSIKIEIFKKRQKMDKFLLFQQIDKEYFEDINRNHFDLLIYNGEYGLKNWGEIFCHIFNKYDKKEIVNLIEQLYKTPQFTNSFENRYISIEQKNYIMNYISNTIKICQIINVSYLRLIRCGIRYRISETNKNYVYFSYDEIPSHGSDKRYIKLTPIEIDEELNLLFDIIKSQKMIKNLPLDDKNYIQSYFNISYRKLYALLYLLSNLNEKEKQTVTGGELNIVNNVNDGATVDIEFKIFNK